MPKRKPVRYAVLHTFGHEGVLIGPWNAERVGSLPPEKLARALELGHVRPLESPEVPTPAPDVAPVPESEE